MPGEGRRGGLWKDRSCCCETYPRGCHGSWYWLCPPGMPTCPELRTGGAHLLLSLCPQGQRWGSGSPSQGGPTPARAVGNQVLSITYSWGGTSTGGPRAQVGLGRARRGGGPHPGESLAAQHWMAARNEEGAWAPGRQSEFKSLLCLFKALGSSGNT